MNMQEARVVKTAYAAIDDRIRSQKIYRLPEVSALKYVAWDGRTPTPIVSVGNTIISVLGGYPGPTDQWLKLQDQASLALEDARLRADVCGTSGVHRRGKFETLRCGVSHGGGQTRPGNLRNNPTNRKLAQELNELEPFKRFSGFATSLMATWAPKLYAYYVKHLSSLHDHYPALHRIFPSSIFAASTYNLGPRTVCFRHTDFANLAYGWCAVTALGSFNPKTSGHLVLWECGLVIEFPPGSTILLPSAIVSHCNLSIGASETRYSFTQYTAGGLFRWVENDFKTTVAYQASLSPAELRDLDHRNENRWSLGLSLLSQLEILSTSST
ncbi:hypothetical protein BJ912DRAFT_1019823 [Pholiota molesta]|nr:hypothetical protein BJ912DRAFT_1019823 [Pholiota molesta]